MPEKSHEKITYRFATEKDIPALCTLRKTQLLDEGMAATCDIDAALQRFFEHTLPCGKLLELVCEADGVIIATGALRFYEYPPSYKNPTGVISYVANMYTQKEYRRRGIATEILHRLNDETRRRGITVMRLCASDFGRPVYEKDGFEQDTIWFTKNL